MNSEDNSEVPCLKNKASPFLSFLLSFSVCNIGQQLLSFDFEPRHVRLSGNGNIFNIWTFLSYFMV